MEYHSANGMLGLNGDSININILWNDVSMIQEAANHVFILAAFYYLIVWVIADADDLCCRVLLMVGFLSRNDGAYVARGKLMWG